MDSFYFPPRIILGVDKYHDSGKKICPTVADNCNIFFSFLSPILNKNNKK
jgi:hypothetical protein